MSLSKRLFLAVCLAAAASFVLVPGASAGNFDEQKMGCTGDNPATCPDGTVGQPYSLTIYLAPPNDGRGEDFGCATFAANPGGNVPVPGLSISDEGYITGTPSQAGTYEFWLIATLNKEPWCATSCGSKCQSDDKFIMKINPGVPPKPKLTIGPDQAGVPIGTVGTPFSLPMTASVADPKTWSISAGALPPGLNLGVSDGLISGTPTAAGAYAFTVQAQIDATRTATQSFTLNVRDALTIAGPTDPALEVGVRYQTVLKGNGGLRTYKWALTAGAMPPGLTFFPGGAITGRPTTAGEFEFTVTLTDSEGRTTTYDGSLTIAARLAVATTQLTGRAGRAFRKKVVTLGGIDPTSMRLKKGPLPGGVRFDPATASFVGTPKKDGTWSVIVEVVDALKVKAKATIVLVVAPGK